MRHSRIRREALVGSVTGDDRDTESQRFEELVGSYLTTMHELGRDVLAMTVDRNAARDHLLQVQLEVSGEVPESEVWKDPRYRDAVTTVAVVEAAIAASTPIVR